MANVASITPSPRPMDYSGWFPDISLPSGNTTERIALVVIACLATYLYLQLQNQTTPLTSREVCTQTDFEDNRAANATSYPRVEPPIIPVVLPPGGNPLNSRPPLSAPTQIDADERVAIVNNVLNGYNPDSTHIMLRRLKLNRIPTGVFYYSKLERLYLDRNNIQVIPGDIDCLSNLQLLNLQNNALEKLPEMTIGTLFKLTELDLQDNHIQELPKDIKNLSNLNSFSLNNNRIQELPEGLWELSKLSSLYLSNNLIQQLPAEIGRLSNLKTLNLRNNLIQELPAEIERLSNLNHFDVQGNSITEFPKQVENLPRLRLLSLENNQLTEVPIDIIRSLLQRDCFIQLGGNLLTEETREALRELKTSSESFNQKLSF